MATYGSTIRRGLPRVAGAEPWPPAGDAPVEAAPVVERAQRDETTAPAVGEPPVVAPAVVEPPVVERAQRDETTAPAPSASRSLRRGLPRTPGGEPWPPAGAVAPVAAATAAAAAAAPEAPAASPAVPAASSVAATPPVVERAPGDEAAAPAPAAASHPLRRGLPRTPGGEPWPPAGTARAAAPAEPAAAAAAPAETSPAEVVPTKPALDVSTPLPFTRTVWAGAAASTRPAPKPEPARIGPFTKLQWAGIVIVGGGGLLVAAFLAVVFVRAFLSLPFMVDFLTTYPGEYHLPEGAPVGVPPWLGWQHFFNVFLMVLVIRTGLTIRTEKRPTAFWTPRGNPKRKISLTMWFHQSLDLLWVVNGVIFIVLLFVTGQWMKIVPTSWEVIPNAISAALQYVSLDWPTENGWVNYNALQQLAYFATVFIAAPLAIATGVRMSGIWPKNSPRLNKAYPIEWARAVHFPVMLYFVLFIFVHVVLVFATGALRNLNHMYASLGSTDPDAYAMNWTGFWIFAASLVVIGAAWVAARPLVLAPIARLFGSVSGR